MPSNVARRVGELSDAKGNAIIELALVLPILVLLLMAVFDYSRAIHAQSIITNMSREGANLIARANTNLSGNEATDFQNVLDLIGKSAQPLDMVNQGMMYIYKVSKNNNQVTTTSLGWNRSVATQKPGMSGGVGGITLADGQTVYGVEVYYKYKSIFFGSLYEPMLQSISIF